jgi:hypothetical protein
VFSTALSVSSVRSTRNITFSLYVMHVISLNEQHWAPAGSQHAAHNKSKGHADWVTLSLDDASGYLRCKLSTTGLQPAVEVSRPSSLEASDIVSALVPAPLRSAPYNAQPGLNTSLSPAKTLPEGTAAKCKGVSKKEVIVRLVVQETSGRVAVIITPCVSGAKPVGTTSNQPCTLKKELMPGEKLSKDAANVRLTLQVQPDGLVSVSMQSSRRIK